jgi:hypothetical protein
MRAVAGRALLRVAIAAVLANSTWFSATAVVPALARDWQLTAAGAAWLAIAVQAGFIAGSVASAVLNLPDRLEPRRLMAAAAVAAGAFNAELLAAGGLTEGLPSRFLVGVAIAGVYAPGVRLVAPHFDRRRGVAAGVVVGALTLGSSTPHLVRGLANIPWQATIAARPRSRCARAATVAHDQRLPRTHVGAVRVLGMAADVLRRLTRRGTRQDRGQRRRLRGDRRGGAGRVCLAEPEYAGSALTLQLALGFALIVASIRLVPAFAAAFGWRYALLPLAAGPLLGAATMLRLRALPAAFALAGGRR